MKPQNDEVHVLINGLIIGFALGWFFGWFFGVLVVRLFLS